MDDTNPEKEESEYVNAIIDDVRWLGFDWGDRLYYASDYFNKIYTNWNTLEVTTTAPNGVTKGRKGKMMLYHSGAVELWVNLDGEFWWGKI
jgi:hypothetical protein